MQEKSHRIGYVVKRYPRYSETFIVNEILAHEKIGLDIEIFALRPPCDSHFQNIISQVKASVSYIKKPTQGRKSAYLNSVNPTAASYFWAELQETAGYIPDIWQRLAFAAGESASVVYQGLWLAREVRLKNITHLHAHFASVATSVARLAAHFADIPYTFTAHAKDIFHDSVNVDDFARKLRDAQSVITVSDYNKNYLTTKYGALGQNVQRIYNGLDVSQFSFQSPDNRLPRIISVGRLVEKKGLSILVDACDLLNRWGCDFECQIIGSGDLHGELHRQILDLNLQYKVSLKGDRPQNEVFKLVQESAVFVAPYIIGKDGNRDGLPTVLLESMALGTPCIATDVTGIPELVIHEKTGLIIPQQDVKSLALAIQKFLIDKDLRVRCAVEARKLIESDFNIYQNSQFLRQNFLGN
ncbi:glycosyltransferase [Cyanobacterium stanieri LEGE 03274]|uniref:Glycosyltransferase n=1 Tax=Cyanobacterium stanieri LEGE 03274 TaxID=1828756 RepID=A0ABR9V0N2_9CHRO|nr:glycosyltransferase [Cyanobacterium stanieri]MBE9221440.1 glycosyltransferase [Cyanobacterium stanieri LEGE 03274]